MCSVRPSSGLLFYVVAGLIGCAAWFTMIAMTLLPNMTTSLVGVSVAGAVMAAVPVVVLAFMIRNGLFSEEVAVEFPDGIRKPRRKGKKIRFESPGLDEDQMRQIHVAADLFRKRKKKSSGGLPTTVKFEDFDPFEPDGDEEKGKSEVPLLWDYNPRCLPREFYDVKPESYMVDPLQANFCHFAKNVVIRICSMLHPLDFVELSLTCRFLHWRMFTFCTCYAPYTVRMEIIGYKLKEGLQKYQAAPKMLYCEKGKDDGLFVLKPTCLKSPFVFETLELSVELPSQRYQQALKHVLPVRKHANRVKLIHYKENPGGRFCADAVATLMKELKVNSFRFWFDIDIPGAHDFLTGFDSLLLSRLWLSAEYFYKMEEACVTNMDPNRVLKLMNRFGIYVEPRLIQISDTLAEFYGGDCGLEFHAYIGLPFAVIYGLKIMCRANEYYSERHGHFWMVCITDRYRNGLTLKVYKKDDEAVVLLGRSKTFFKNQRHYHRLRRIAARDPAEDDSDEEDYPDDYDDDRDGKYWRMETAVEATKDKKKDKKKWWRGW